MILSPYATHISQDAGSNGKQSPRKRAFTLRTLPIVAKFSSHASEVVFHLTMVPSPLFQYWVGRAPIHSSSPTVPIPITTEDEPILPSTAREVALVLLSRYIR